MVKKNVQPKSIKQNTVYNMLKTFSSIVFPLITFPYVSRVLNPVGIGRYNFSNTYVSYFSLLASLGITTYAIRECAAVRDDHEKLEKFSSQIFSINICTMIIAYVILFFSLLVSRRLDSYRNLIIVFSSNILFTIAGADWINSAFEDFRYITFRTFGMQCVSLICIFIFVRKPSDVMNYALITVLASGGANFLNMFYRRKFCRIRFTKKMDWRKHMPGIMMLFVMLLAQTIFSNTDITMLGLMVGDREVGLYSTAVKIMNIINQVLASIVWVILPRASVYYEKHQIDDFNALMRKILEYMVGLGFPIVVGTIELAPQIVELIGGKEYLDATLSLRILMVSLGISLVGGSFIGNVIMLSTKKEKHFMNACLIAAVVNVILNYFLIKLFHQYGAAIATSASSVIIFLYLLPRVDSSVHIENIKDVFIAPVFGSIVMGIVVYSILKLQLGLISEILINVIVGAASYLIILIIFRYDLVTNIIVSAKNKIKGNSTNGR